MAGATYVVVTIDEIMQHLKRSFRALNPKLAEYRGWHIVNLTLSKNVRIVVHTATLVQRGGVGAESGETAMRVGLYPTYGRQLEGSDWRDFPIIKRTMNWRDNMRERIEDTIREYDAQEEMWESLAAERMKR